MLHAQHARCGAVLAIGKAFWLLWDADRPRPLCFPIVNRRQPLTRWDLPIAASIPGMPGNALIAASLRGREIETSGAVIVAQLDVGVIDQMSVRLWRAAESEACEGRFRLKA